MSDDRVWLKFYVSFFDDFAILDLLDRFGAAGPLAFVKLLVVGKIAGWVHGEGNVVVSYQALAASTGTDVDRAREIVEAMGDVGLLDVTDLSPHGFHAVIVGWGDRQTPTRPLSGAQRMAKHRAGKSPELPDPVSPEVVTHVTESDADVTARDVRSEKGEVKDKSFTSGKDRSEVISLCDHLAARLVANDPKAKPKPESRRWRDECRRLLDIDDRSAAEVGEVIEWATRDKFWRSNILSMPTLRDKFPRLRMQMHDRGAANVPPPPPEPNWPAWCAEHFPGADPAWVQKVADEAQGRLVDLPLPERLRRYVELQPNFAYLLEPIEEEVA